MTQEKELATQELRNLTKSLTEAAQALESVINQINSCTIKETCEAAERIEDTLFTLTPEVRRVIKGIFNESDN